MPSPVFALKRRCHAAARQSGEQCKNFCSPGWTVCRFHGKGSGAPSTTYRYSTNLDKNPILRKNFELILAEGSDDFDISPEIVLLRARLASALENPDIDPKVLSDIHRDLVRGVQKNIELQIKRQGLIQRSDAEKMLRAAVKVIVGYVPASVKGACFEELGRVLAGTQFGEAAVIQGELVEPAQE